MIASGSAQLSYCAANTRKTASTASANTTAGPKRATRSSGAMPSRVDNWLWNVLTYGRILNNVRLQDAQFQALVAGYQNTVLTAGQEVENGLATFLEAQDQVKALAESVKAANKAVTVALAQYEGGKVDFNRVALLEQNLVQQQNLLAQAQGSISLGLIQVYRALGGGWQIRTTGCESKEELPPPASAGRHPGHGFAPGSIRNALGHQVASTKRRTTYGDLIRLGEPTTRLAPAYTLKRPSRTNPRRVIPHSCAS
jgi:hypothetical protein